MTPDDGVVRAAGGVVVRRGASDVVELLAVHRATHDDWSFPKGKLDPGERWKDAALREVQEETGIAAELGPELPSARYHDSQGRPKLVRYWLMAVVDDHGFEANAEIAAIRWVPIEVARELLTYDHDRALLSRVEDLP